jgi:tetratricopeptide (TPR) repeat protein
MKTTREPNERPPVTPPSDAAAPRRAESAAAAADACDVVARRAVAFTGRLASMSRRALADALRRLDIIPVEDVTRRTALLVVGQLGWPLRADGTLNHKVQQALRLQGSGGVRIVGERDWLGAAGLTEAAAALDEHQRAESLAPRLGLPAASLRQWSRLGLLPGDARGFVLREVVSLRVLMGLVARGVDRRVLRGSLQRLRPALPEVELALRQLERLTQHDDDVLAELDVCRATPDGQMMLGFADQASLEDAPVVISFAVGAAQSLSASPERLTSDQWFERGRRLEELEQYDAAARAYREALAGEARFPEAYFNLGNTLRALGRAEAASEMYLLALAQDPTLACAWYNLADIAEEAGRLDEAIAHLEKALEACPTYADAHFNLAHCLEAAGRKSEAERHWAAYLRYDQQSEWATLARRRLGRSS